MWLGYWSPVAVHLARPRAAQRFRAKWLPNSNELKPLALPILVVISIGSRLMQIQLGVFGYSSNYDRMVEAGGFTQYLGLAAG